MNRLHHDCSFVLALYLLEPVAHLLREEEKNELFGRYYDTITATLEVYDATRERLAERRENDRHKQGDREVGG